MTRAVALGLCVIVLVWLKPDATYVSNDVAHVSNDVAYVSNDVAYVRNGVAYVRNGVACVASGFSRTVWNDVTYLWDEVGYVASGFHLRAELRWTAVALAQAVSRTVLAQAAPGRQAVIETTAGTFVIDLAPEAAPNQTAYFVKTAGEGGYVGTIFHRAIKYGMVQGGDPLSKDPSKRASYGTGGLNAVKAEPHAPKMTRGSVAAVTIPGRPDSAGTQFFVVLADQPALDGQYTVFGHVSDGMDVLMKISETPVDAGGLATDRIEIRRVTIRDTPPEPFVNDTPQELAAYHAVLDTSSGPITIELLTDKAPNTVRQFMRLAAASVYNGMAVHRVAPGFVIQTGSLGSRTVPLTERQQALVHPLQSEFSDVRHVKGIVSMARGDDPGSATTSFFICTGSAPALDGQYTAFGRVVDGMAAVEAIEAAPRNGETPVTRIELRTLRIEKR